jgi:hypothetical protein
MNSVYVNYDRRSGQIIGVHVGHVDSSQAHQRVKQHAKIDREHISVIEVPYETFERGKRYKIDLSRKIVVEAGKEERGLGFGFGFGKTAQMQTK